MKKIFNKFICSVLSVSLLSTFVCGMSGYANENVDETGDVIEVEYINFDFEDIDPSEADSVEKTANIIHNKIKAENGGSFEYKFTGLPTSGAVSYKQNNIRFPDLSGNGAYSDEKVTTGADLDPNANFTVENGKLVFRQGGTKYSQQLDITLKSKITTGTVVASFDLTFPEKFAMSGSCYNWHNGIIIFGQDAGSNNVQFGTRNAGNDKFLYLNGDQTTGYKNATNFDAGTRHFEIVTDLETKLVKLFMDNGEEPIVTKQYASNVDLGVSHIYFTFPAYNASYPLAMPDLGETDDGKYKYEYSIDNLRVTKQYKFEVTDSNVTDGQEAVDNSGAIELTFSDDVNDKTLDGIKMYEGTDETGTEISISKSVSGKVCTINYSDLKYGSEYTLVADNTVTNNNGKRCYKYMTTFTTSFDKNDVNYNAAPIIDSSNVSNNMTGVNPDNAIEINFNTPIRKSGLGKFSLYENDILIENPDFTISTDGKTITYDGKMKYSMPYKLVIADGVLADNGKSLSGSEISFHTMHKPMPVTVSQILLLDENDAPITEFTGQESLSAELLCSNSTSSESNAMIVIALWRNGMMENIFCKTHKIPGNTDNTPADITVQLPAEQTGLSAKIYVWDGYGTMNSLASCVSIP